MDNLKRLGVAMSDVSERCYCAGWLGGAEYLLPELCRRVILTNEPQPWGYSSVTLEEAEMLTALSDEIGSWADLDDNAAEFVRFKPFPIPAEYIEELDRQLEERKLESDSN